jgi:glycosyltransferase involved in cell wall biosynthesis
VKRIVVAIYIDPDFFPPTINAILNLAEVAEEVVVISRNNSVADFPYPANVSLKKIGKKVSVRDSEKQSVFMKTFYLLKFVFTFRSYAKSKKTELVLVYDTLALFGFFLIKFVRQKRKIWYHNHDMPDRAKLSKCSIGGLAAKYEEKAMQYIHFFSLPSKDRLQYFPKLLPSIPVFIIPNYPSLRVYQQENVNKELKEPVRIIYQGFIGKGHSLEECILLLQEKINGFGLQLVLKGSVTSQYKGYLNTLADQYQVRDQLIWEGIGPYNELPALTGFCEIGIGINMNTDPVSLAQATASNKIYEYAASGLPVVLYNSKQFINQLQQYDWISFSDGSVESLKEKLYGIIKNWQKLSKSARRDFQETLNFENVFIPTLKIILETRAKL